MSPIKSISHESRAHVVGTLNRHPYRRALPPTLCRMPYAPHWEGRTGRNPIGAVDLTSPETDQCPDINRFKVRSGNRASEPIHGGLS
jgi:hypothetical protein